jgi:eukaryotic-like serine/threonine-protein kinase
MPLSAGDKLGPYEILAPIGAGGMGEVYRARDTKLEREVAIKVLPAALAQDPERLARFEREAKVLASLNHPNIAQIYGIDESSTGPALVMELVPGQTLKGSVGLDEALRIAGQVADALEAAHDKGITHRDLKPANIMITPGGLVKVLDFGLAAVTQPSDVSGGDPSNSPTLTMGATQAGMILGTAGYMSPEQTAGQSVDKRADIWAFGVVLYEMLTGQRLFTGDTIAHILADVLRAPIDFDKLPQQTPRAIGDLVKRCLDRDVKNRLRDIGEARVALRRYLANPAAMEPEGSTRTLAGPVRPQPWIAATMFFAITAAGLGFVVYRHTREAPSGVTRLSLLPPEKGEFGTAAGVGPPSLSPDGRRIVFPARVGGKNALWVRDLDSPTPRILPGTEDGIYPFWSPDSRFVGFNSGGKLKKVAVSGGAVLTICDVTFLRGASWNKDDVIVFAPSLSSVLFRVPAAGGIPTPVTSLDASRSENSHRFPWFLPDGHHFVYLARSSNADQTAVFVGDLQSKARKLILRGNSNTVYVEPGYLLFLRDRTLMAQPLSATRLALSGYAVPIAEQVDFVGLNNEGLFTASQNGVLAYASGVHGGDWQITWFDRAGKVLGTVGKPVDIEWASLSPDGKAVATDRLDPQSGNRDIWLYDLARGTEQRLTFSGENRFPIWSPDGTRIAFDGNRGGIGKIYLKAANGTGQEEVLETGGPIPADWSRDGRYLLFVTGQRNRETASDIWVLPFSDKKAFPYLRTEFNEDNSKLSPDGRWLAYQSNESKRNEIYVMTFPMPGGKWQISSGGGRFPVWSRDGRELYYLSADNKLMAVEIKPGVKFEAGVPHPLFDVRRGVVFDVSKDGNFLIPTTAEQSASAPVTVVLNWQEGLEK